MKILLVILVFFSLSAVAAAQGSDNSSTLIPGDRRGHGRDPLRPENPLEAEMIHSAEIRRGEESHRELVERARENARLGCDLKAAADSKSALAGEDLKKLERMESLARKIRGGSGGDGDVEAAAAPPHDLVSALKLLAEASDDLLKKVEKTSRLVTSYSVVQRSNEVIQLVRHVKSLVRR